MGFQGDVAGIGLGELLQGLSRGGREGVLTLHAEKLTATLGVQQGQIFLLPEPDEDPEIWRKRVQRAWVKDPNERIDSIRMSDIAFASRLETAFTLLDCEGVHFRFEPGPLPTAQAEEETVAMQRDREARPKRRAPVHCPGISVEYLLLEHARLSDESQGHGQALRLSVHDVLRIYDPARVVAANERFCSECDGMSNIIEIADRLSWPLRQCRAWAQEMIAQGVLRISDEREMLVQGQREIAQDQYARAASRLSGWVLRAPPGPPPAGDAQLLSNAWIDGKLQIVLGFMDARHARRMLRRIELVEQDPRIAFERWREMRKHHRHDLLTEVRMLGWQLRSDDESIAPAMTDLLKLARNFQDAGSDRRAGVMLRAAAARQPETTSMRLELGTRLMSVGLIDDGAPWVLEACRTLIKSGHAEKALQPLRGVLGVDGGNREARSLLQLARARSARGRRRRRIALVCTSILLLMSLAAVVQLRIERRHDRKLAEISDRADQPREALAMLDEAFPTAEAARVETLRKALIARIEREESALRDAWMDRYRETELECNLGDPLIGLKRAFELPPHPRAEYIEVEWPKATGLMHGLAARLEQSVAEWNASPEEPQSELNAEERMLEVLDDLDALVEEHSGAEDVEGFIIRLEALRTSISERRAQRENARIERERTALEREQDMLLAAARAHQQAGDLERAVQTFQRLLATPNSQVLADALRPEIEAVEEHYEALVEARRLSLKGEHERALAVLGERCQNPTEHQLPWQVESEPSGATARFPDGTTRTTPFSLQSAPREHVDFVLELEGHEDFKISMDDPADQFALLSRLPERWWRTSASVDAPPIAIGDEHVVGDRSGRLVRFDANSRAVWESKLDSLGGIARAPVFLPGRPSHMLAVTEDGQAWLVEAASGRLEGPWSLQTPPGEGPRVEGDAVVVKFTDGRIARWTSRLKPDIEEPPDAGGGDGSGAGSGDGGNGASNSGTASGNDPRSFGTSAGLEILRRRSGAARTLVSPWVGWQVTVEDGHFVVQRTGERLPAFRVRRQDPWAYVAWEAPNASLPQGRLWISDGAGLRAFEPR